MKTAVAYYSLGGTTRCTRPRGSQKGAERRFDRAYAENAVQPIHRVCAWLFGGCQAEGGRAGRHSRCLSAMTEWC